MNAGGRIAGTSYPDHSFRAVVWTTPTSAPVELPTLQGYLDYASANAVTDDGRVAGESITAAGGELATVWTCL